MKRIINSIITLCLISMLAISCDKEPEVQPAPNASVTISVQKTTAGSIEFTVTPENSIRYAYAFAKSTEISSAEFITVDGDEPSILKMEELDAATEYTILANATNADGKVCETVSETAETTDRASVQIEVLSSGIHNVEFRITPVNAVAYRFAVLESSDAETATLDQKVENGDPATYTLDDLESNTRYAVVAQAEDQNGDLSERAYGNFVTDKNPVVKVESIESDINSAYVRVSTVNVDRLYYAVTMEGEQPESYVEVKDVESEMDFYIYDLEMSCDYSFIAYGLNLHGKEGESVVSAFSTKDESEKDFSLVLKDVSAFDAILDFSWNEEKYKKALFIVGEPTALDSETFDFEANRYNLFEVSTPGGQNLKNYGSFLAGKDYRIGVVFIDVEDNMDLTAVIWKNFRLKDVSFGDSDAEVEFQNTILSYSTIGYKVINKGNAVSYHYDMLSTSDVPEDLDDWAKLVISRSWTLKSDFDTETILTHQQKEQSYTMLAVPVDEEGHFGKICTMQVTTSALSLDGTGIFTAELSSAEYAKLKFDVKLGNGTKEVLYVKFKEGDNGYESEEKIIDKLAYAYNSVQEDKELVIDYLQTDTEYNIWFASLDQNYKLGNLEKMKVRTRKPEYDGTGNVAVSIEKFSKEEFGYKGSIKLVPDENISSYYYRLCDQSVVDQHDDDSFVGEFLAGTSYPAYQEEYLAAGWDGKGEYLGNQYYVIVLPIDLNGHLCPLIKYRIEETFN